MTHKEAKKLKKGQKIWIVFYFCVMEARFIATRRSYISYEYKDNPSSAWCQGADMLYEAVFSSEKEAKILLAKNKIKQKEAEITYAKDDFDHCKRVLASSKGALTKAQKELDLLICEK